MGNCVATLVQGFGAAGGAERMGDTCVTMRDIKMSNSYATAGDVLSPQQVGLTRVDSAVLAGISQTPSPTTDVELKYNVLTGKMQAFWSGNAIAASPEVTNTTDLSAVVRRFLFYGTGAN
jgi:hypothetical protein